MSPLILQKIMAGEIFDSALVFQYIGLAIVTAITVSLSGFTRIFANARTTRNIQNTLWSKYIRVPLPFFDKEPSLLLISRLTHDPQHINNNDGSLSKNGNGTRIYFIKNHHYY